jgi:hypothetical protein
VLLRSSLLEDAKPRKDICAASRAISVPTESERK